MTRDDFRLFATAVLFAAFRTDQKPTKLEDDVTRAYDEAIELTDAIIPAEKATKK